MSSLDTQIAAVRALLGDEEIIAPGSPEYDQESRTWAVQKNLHPRLIAHPASAATLGRLLSHLDTTDLEVGVRSTGIGGGSARDVLISLTRFKDFSFDRSSETILVGAGHTWGEVDRKLEASEGGEAYAAVSARCTYVGVAGSILAGGQSWLSSEYGLGCDPQNFLDAEVVKMDGSVVWASAEPDLLWALRGGGGGFGVVTKFKLKVYPYPRDIFCGQIVYPAEALQGVAQGVADFSERCKEPKVAMHLYVLDMSMGAMTGKDPKPGLAIFVYDALGEEHGRSEAGFKWALDIPGAMDLTKVLNYSRVTMEFDGLEANFGKANTWGAGVTVPAITAKLIVDAWEWYLDLLKKDANLVNSTYVLMELMQKATYQSLAYPATESAWPHTRNQHNLQLGTGAPPGNPATDELAHRAMAEGPYQIRKEHTGADYFPNFIEDFVDAKQVFGPNWDKCVTVKKKYDPNNKLGGPFGAAR